MVDVHAHLNLEEFKNDYSDIIQKSFDNGVKAIINVGTNFSTSQKAIEIANNFKNCFAAIGLHPINAYREFDRQKYVNLITKNKNVVKAVGETGLDYYRIIGNKLSTKNLQKKIFLEHLKLANKFHLPIIIHCRAEKEMPREPYLDLIKILKNFKDLPEGEIHCFTSDWEIAQQFLNLGFYIGFTGIITFKNVSKELLKVVKETPLDRILAETDCPFLAPEPYRGKRNEPSYVRFTLEKIAMIKNLPFNIIEKKIDDNSKKLFRLTV